MDDSTDDVSRDVFGRAYNKTAPGKKPARKNVSEKWVKEQVRKILKAEGVWYCTPIGMGMGPPAHDFVCCVPSPTGGQFLSIETKASKGALTKRQIETTNAIIEAGGEVVAVYPEDIEGLRVFIRQMKNGES